MKRGIPVSNAPGHNAEAVADHAFGLLLGEVRNIIRGDNMIREGRWTPGKRPMLKSTEMNGKTLGIVGFGEVGSLIPKRAKGFGLKILVHDPYVLEEKINLAGGEKVDFETLLKESDFITVHVRLTDETYHMFGEKQFNLMKPSTYFVNTSRGPVIDEEAIYEAMKNHRIAGAGLDVFEEEPMRADHPLLTLTNVIVTPHIAYLGTSFLRGANMAAEEVNRFVKGEPLKYVVSPTPYKFEREMYDKIFRGQKIR
jgi:phosphoglycerate dehydrogenase-like enzyme